MVNMFCPIQRAAGNKIPGVVKADALFGAPDAIAIVEGEDVASMDKVIDAIVQVKGVAATDSKVARWIDCILTLRIAYGRPDHRTGLLCRTRMWLGVFPLDEQLGLKVAPSYISPCALSR
jgi:hypothetical protein